jgi:DNA-binding NarL/FixJ family response regulator
LCALLSAYSEIEIVGEACDGAEALEIIARQKPDVVLLDVEMPNIDGIEATREIRALPDPPKVLALSMHDQKRFVSEMLLAGASGYLLKDTDIDDVVQAVRTILAGKSYLSAALVDVVVEDYVMRLSPDQSSVLDALTSREKETMKLLVEGHNSKEIAGIFNVSVKTVDTYRLQIARKLNTHSLAELTKLAIREGLTGL